MKTFASLLALAGGALAQFPPEPEGIRTVKAQYDEDVSVSYKETDICEMTPGVSSYTGYVHLPPGTLDDLGNPQEFPINTFFWYFEARNDPENAPLSIWMNGGPGSSSMLGLLAENGPCFVNSDSNSTYNNTFAWNNNVNMLFLDQPVQVGLSYDTLQNVTVDLISGDIVLLNDTDTVPEQNATFLVGTYPSQETNSTTFGSMNGAYALWHFAQVWFSEFPGYHPNDGRISIATESYGGRYGPAYAAFFQEQNDKISNGTWDDAPMSILDMDTLLIVNGCIDRLVSYPYYAEIAFKNTYGIEVVNETIYDAMVEDLNKPGGCLDNITYCRDVAAEYDPMNIGINETVNEICESAENNCRAATVSRFSAYGGRNYYDFATLNPDPFPAPFYQGFLNQQWVQRALGVPLNWTQSNGVVSSAFRGIGDYVRPGWLEDMAYLLESGTKVQFMFSDRDYACNWLGGEATSLEIPWEHQSDFAASGYQDIETSGEYVGGAVRQYGNLSFTRVYQSGHEIPSYQPETSLLIFERALFNRDIATGEVSTIENPDYATVGPLDTLHIRNVDPEEPVHFCYYWDYNADCTDEEVEMVQNGTALLCQGILKDSNSTMLFPGVMGEMGTDECGDGPGEPYMGPEGGVFSRARGETYANNGIYIVDGGNGTLTGGNNATNGTGSSGPDYPPPVVEEGAAGTNGVSWGLWAVVVAAVAMV